jgi:hypothetical protein
MVFDIVTTSAWRRPIYFAMTVSDDGKIGLRDYMQLEGLAFRLTPRRGQAYWANIDESKMHTQLFTNVEQPSKTHQFGFLWRGLRDTTTYFDEDVRRLMMNYRQAYILLGLHYMNALNQPAKLAEVMDRMEEVIPRNVIPMDYRTKTYVANFYNVAGNKEKYREISMEIINELKTITERGVAEPLSFDNPYVVLLQTYEGLEMYDEALKLIDLIRVTYASEKEINQIVAQLKAEIDMRRSMSTRHDTLASAKPPENSTEKPAAKGK